MSYSCFCASQLSQFQILCNSFRYVSFFNGMTTPTFAIFSDYCIPVGPNRSNTALTCCNCDNTLTPGELHSKVNCNKCNSLLLVTRKVGFCDTCAIVLCHTCGKTLKFEPAAKKRKVAVVLTTQTQTSDSQNSPQQALTPTPHIDLAQGFHRPISW